MIKPRLSGSSKILVKLHRTNNFTTPCHIRKVGKPRCQALQNSQLFNSKTKADTLTKDLQVKRDKFPERRMAFLAAPNLKRGIPAIDGIVVVEGMADFAAVYNAVCSPIFVFGGAGKNEQFGDRLARVQQRCKNLIVLTDADLKGRQLRNYLDERLGPLSHAFIPIKHSINTTPTKNHEIGNVGVEHASVEVIQQAIQKSQLSDPKRKFFTRQNLEEWNLLGKQSGDEGAFRRAIFCNVLGIGNSNGKQLLRQLNQYGFQLQQVQDAVGIVDQRFEKVLQLWKYLSQQEDQSLTVSDVDCQLYVQQIMQQKHGNTRKSQKEYVVSRNIKQQLNQLVQDVNQSTGKVQ
eukprot:TRINITY_DN18997_c0_g4_i2.p1 TRINITY_DN18997_c0_g4~~TRINITY_DN18997_c0_g4_i2.p1  ORF type:complete len:399 (-),score=21.37 TRINITY_DN18997_c0_g4_i2:191-1231(-)